MAKFKLDHNPGGFRNGFAHIILDEVTHDEEGIPILSPQCVNYEEIEENVNRLISDLRNVLIQSRKKFPPQEVRNVSVIRYRVWNSDTH